MDDKQGAVLDHFRRGGTLTVVTCRELYHTTELRRVVSRLINAGYPIEGRKLNGDIYKTYSMAVPTNWIEELFDERK